MRTMLKEYMRVMHAVGVEWLWDRIVLIVMWPYRRLVWPRRARQYRELAALVPPSRPDLAEQLTEIAGRYER